MDDAALVSRFEGVSDLRRDPQRLVERDRTLGDAVGQRRSLDQLQHECRRAVALLEPVDRRDVGMVQGGERPGLALEADDAVRVGPEHRRQNLDRHVAIELRVARAIDLAHPAAAERRHHDVSTDAQARLEARRRFRESVVHVLAAGVQEIDREAVERPLRALLRQERFDFPAHLRLRLRQELRDAIRRGRARGVEQLLDLTPVLEGHEAGSVRGGRRGRARDAARCARAANRA